MKRSWQILLFSILSICSTTVWAAEEPAVELPPPTIRAELSAAEVAAGQEFTLKIIASWQAGPGYQLLPDVTIPDGLIKGPVTADSQSFGKTAGELVYTIPLKAEEPAEYVFADLTVRYWLAGHADAPQYARLSAQSIKVVPRTYLGLSLMGLLALCGGLILLLVGAYLLVVIRKKKKLARLNKKDPAAEEYALLQQIELAVLAGEVERALASLVTWAKLQGDQKQENEYKSMHERAAYGGGAPTNSDLKYFLHLAQLSFNQRFPEYKPGQKEEDNE